MKKNILTSVFTGIIIASAISLISSFTFFKRPLKQVFLYQAGFVSICVIIFLIYQGLSFVSKRKKT